ncbi:aspartyl/asparaginyl beta-hydroxylase domain-containing protein [Temperatibacter marinus]|uniref:Aspartyl/asparaginyl beta-hydroxylase domain-containing protein n=1 Tax=Temperatibacter marinus TaxID=1456591 RepID=A0AA52EFX7_9PROT|nr:aspartyl/asparaginyl beta-hydroxylase domain-containing protein [Temperatibacter marinus]WND04051.1 aspartyl/asparaginyl beta-hydroxylase domain-containing protein [Temperatibacter marinus]
MSHQSIQQELQNCLNKGAGREALSLAKDLAAFGGTPPWMVIAKLCNSSGHHIEEEDALMHRLKEQRSDLGAISALAELKRKQDDRRAAESFYQLGLGTVAQMPNPPQAVINWISRAQDYLKEGKDVYSNHVLDHLSKSGIDLAKTSPQVQEAFTLLTGQSELFLQQPNMFFFPGLPHRAWFERKEFDWVEEVESYTEAIVDELSDIIGNANSFEPYVQGQPGRPSPNNPLLDDPSWGAGYLWKSGERQDALADKVPSAMKALEAVDMPLITDRAPMALFSRLKPDTHIKPHHGALNTRLICHLPLIVPEGCALRVGAETRSWETGKMFFFDDSIEHEAWNRGTADRTILLFEIWRPEISLEDREALTILFGAISNFNDTA